VIDLPRWVLSYTEPDRDDPLLIRHRLIDFHGTEAVARCCSVSAWWGRCSPRV